RRADVAERRPVRDRHLDLGATGVEGTDDADDLLRARVQLRVRGALGRVPLAGLRRRVVAGLVADRVLAGLVARLLDREGDRLRHLDGLRAARPLQRQVGRDDELRLPGAAVLQRTA